MLEIINTLVIGALFAIWQKSNLLNITIKLALLTLFVANLLRITGKL